MRMKKSKRSLLTKTSLIHAMIRYVWTGGKSKGHSRGLYFQIPYWQWLIVLTILSKESELGMYRTSEKPLQELFIIWHLIFHHRRFSFFWCNTLSNKRALRTTYGHVSYIYSNNALVKDLDSVRVYLPLVIFNWVLLKCLLEGMRLLVTKSSAAQ